MGIICLYLFGLIMGVFNPGDLAGWTILVAALALLVVWHERALHRAMDRKDPETMRALHSARENRGF